MNENEKSNQNFSFSNQPGENLQKPKDAGDYQGYGYDYQAYEKATNPKWQNAAKPPKAPKAPKNNNTGQKASLRIVALALVCALLGGLVGAGGFYYFTNHNVISGGTTNLHIDDSYNSAVEAIAAKDLPSVVGIVLTAKSSGLYSNKNSSNESSVSEGSGVVYKENGYIITNYHVISDALNSSGVTINVYFNSQDSENSDSKGYPATVVGYDATADLAVLKIDAKGLSPIEIGNSDQLKVGQAAVAIGNPGGMSFMGSVSSGIVSGLNRTLTLENGVEMSLIQTDAAINPGNSGGALVNGSGQLIGICSAKLASTSFEGMGFAIPVNNVVSICDNLIANEGKKSPYLGVMLDTRYTAENLQQMGYPAGAVVQSVTENSPAAAAGLKAGDIITKINDTSITNYEILKSELNKYNVGDTVTVEVYRLSSTTTFKVTLGETSSQ